ncbi:MAG TPA: DNA helicase RecG, partial [Paenibacillaceae bacterium]|nr:DNA helicase RecG [Paenibacillaceae bacterium]
MSHLLLAPVTKIKGIGEEKALELKNLKIETLQDLIEHFPYRYEDYQIRDLSEVQDGEKVTVAGVIYGEPVVRFYGRQKSRITVKVVVDQVVVTAVWFNQHFLKNQLAPGKEIRITGKFERSRLQITVNSHSFKTSQAPVGEETIQP